MSAGAPGLTPLDSELRTLLRDARRLRQAFAAQRVGGDDDLHQDVAGRLDASVILGIPITGVDQKLDMRNPVILLARCPHHSLRLEGAPKRDGALH